MFAGFLFLLFFAPSAHAGRCPILLAKVRAVAASAEAADLASRKAALLGKLLGPVGPIDPQELPTKKGKRYLVEPVKLSAGARRAVGLAYRTFLALQLRPAQYAQLSPGEQRDVAMQITLTASAYLQRHGVRHELIRERGRWYLHILPDEHQRLGRAAQRLIAIEGELLFDAQFLLENAKDASFNPLLRKLYLGFIDLPYIRRVEDALPHELDHAQTVLDAVEHLARGDYGAFLALNGKRLPGELQHYVDFCSGDEMTTYRGDVRRAYLKMKTAWDAFKQEWAAHGIDGKFNRPLEKALLHYQVMTMLAAMTKGIAERMILIGEQMAGRMDQQEVYFIADRQGVTLARFLFRPPRGRLPSTLGSVPLVDSKGKRDPRNLALLEAQLTTLAETGRKVRSDADAFVTAAQAIDFTVPQRRGRPDVDALIEKVDRLLVDLEEPLARMVP